MKQLINETLVKSLKIKNPAKLQALNDALSEITIDDLNDMLSNNLRATKSIGRKISNILTEKYGRGTGLTTYQLNNTGYKQKLKSSLPKHNKARFFGVEIECFLPGSYHDNDWEHDGGDDCDEGCCSCEPDDASLETRHEYLKLAFTEAGLPDIEIKEDGSIKEDDGHYPVEITFSFSINNFEKVEKVCKVLNKLGARVNSSCGMHVHIDQRKNLKTTAREQAMRLVTALPMLQRLVPQTRVENTYCKDNYGSLYSDRYYAINWAAYSSHNTIEVRLHSATTNAEKIIQWVRLLHCITLNSDFDFITYIDVKKGKTESIMVNMGLDRSIISYFLKREALFNDGSVKCETVNLSEAA